ncbi:MAG TPA: DNA polymerase III subunit gamma/tau, partial [Firmicutes bacterium]|nr:DNA polymerase III subunit gamma/tau [Bacillota bacterium]
MEYLSLYRRWRPQSFAEVVGQRHVVVTLQRAIARGRLAHAYLFAGPRGTGKTSVARVLAKAVNCRQGPTPEPCLECDVCRAIAAGSCLDVVEMDAASNRGVDEIRQLRENVGLSAVQGRKRVYIVDEVHMLTPEAFNALLKTLEEPPAHVLFVLATTEPHRLPLTIISRCQRFDFHRLAEGEIVGRLQEVVEREQRRVSEDVLGAVARYAEGSLRDAMGLLDQLLAYSPEDVTIDDVWEVLGRAPMEITSAMVEALGRRDPLQVLQQVEQASRLGVDMRQLLRDLIAYLRDLAIYRSCDGKVPAIYLPPGTGEGVREQVQLFSEDGLWDAIKSLAQAEGELRWTSQPRLALELALLRLTVTADALPGSARAALPAAPARPAAPPPRPVSPDPAAAAAPAASPDPAPVTLPSESPGSAAPAEAAEVWNRLLAALRRGRGRGNMVAAMLREGKPLCWEGKQYIVGFTPQYSYHREQIEHVHRTLVEQVLAQIIGSECRLLCREIGGGEV